jgi:hypothetical protein
MRNKLKTKNKLNDTFIFHQGKEREKRDEKKKSSREPNHPVIVHTRGSNRKITAKRFQHHP